MDQTLACTMGHDFCHLDKPFQRVSEMTSVETDQAYDLLLQRICGIEDSIQRYYLLRIISFTVYINLKYILYTILSLLTGYCECATNLYYFKIKCLVLIFFLQAELS